MSVVVASGRDASTSSDRLCRRPAARPSESEPRSWCRGAAPDVATVMIAAVAFAGSPSWVTLYVYSAEPGSPSQRALSLLATWSLTTAPGPAAP